jgi:hypothetical protein
VSKVLKAHPAAALTPALLGAQVVPGGLDAPNPVSVEVPPSA